MPLKSIAMTKIAVRGFKSIWDETEIELCPLTIFAGANSSGKSSIMQPLLLLKQTIEATGDPGSLLLDGPCIRFTQAEQLLSQTSGGVGQSQEFAVRMVLSDGQILEVVFRREKGIGFDIPYMSYFKGEGGIVRITHGMSQQEIDQLLGPPWNSLRKDLSDGQLRWEIFRERCFLSIRLRDTSARKLFFGLPSIGPSSAFIPQLRSLLHLPGLRGNPRRTYAKNAVGSHFPGRFDNYVASIINLWQTNKDKKLIDLGSTLEDMGLTWKVKAKPVDDTQLELRVGRLIHSRRGGARDLVSIADVGFGVSQSLPVVVALIVAGPGQIVYLEQPEIHLHPRAQRALAHVMGTAARRGVVVVAETHSPLLLREIQTLVATGRISKDIVKLHWFQRQADGRTALESAEMDDHGAYGPWPEDFDEIELDTEKQYLDAVESKDSR